VYITDHLIFDYVQKDTCNKTFEQADDRKKYEICFRWAKIWKYPEKSSI